MTDTQRIDVAVIGDGYQLVSDCIQSPQDIETLPTPGRFDEDPGKAPQKAQKGSQDKMGGIDKEEPALALLGFFQPGVQFFFRNSAWACGSALAGT